MKGFLNKTKESLIAILPISIIIIALAIFVVPTTTQDLINFGFSFLLLVLGSTLFITGADSSMMTIGECVGGGLCRTKKLFLMTIITFLIGFIITFAEPDLQVFASLVASQFAGLNNQWVIILTVSLGVAVFFAFALIKIIFNLNISIVLAIAYGVVLILSIFVPKEFVGLALDSGSVTTGPISVPFIMAFGLGIASVRWRNKKDDDSFGMIALCSVGPLISMMIMLLFVKDTSMLAFSNEKIVGFEHLFIHYLKDIAIVILPILLLFLLFQFIFIKLPKKQVLKTLVGLVYTYVGIVLFLVGVNAGFLPLATKFGEFFGNLNTQVWSIIIGAVFGFSCVIAEPALQVLKSQVNSVSHGMIKEKAITIFISIGVAISVAFSILQAIFNFSILWIVIPVYIISIVLGFINSKLFTAISFDSGGVASGTMAVSFILPFVSGIASANGFGAGFGTVSLIACFPILSLQILGLILKIKTSKLKPVKTKSIKKNDIIEFEWEEEWKN